MNDRHESRKITINHPRDGSRLVGSREKKWRGGRIADRYDLAWGSIDESHRENRGLNNEKKKKKNS